jgi:hypothetical protein
MKTLSVTQGNGRVIELDHNEWAEFLKLAGAVDGKTEQEAVWDFQMRRDETQTIKENDYSGTFGAIRAFYEAKFRISEMQTLLNRIKGTVESENK